MKKKLVFLDVETTGVEEEDRLCQVAYKRLDKAGVMENFKPPLLISLDAMSVCHITNEMVEKEPAFQGTKMHKDLKKELEGDAIFVAHNAQFDMKFLAREGIEVKKHICTFKLAHHLDKKADFKKHNLQYLRYMFALKIKGTINPHEALSDVIVLEELFTQVFMKHYTIEEMIKISSEPIIFKKWVFGKYRGRTFQEVARIDMQYMMWFRKQADIDENMLATLNYWINKRS